MPQSYASTNEMVELLELAEDHCADAMLPCKYLYRNKSEEYFNDIFYDGGGIMETELKDNGGDPRSPINGNLEGIFFTANVKRGCYTGEPLPTSPYGESRLFISTNYLIDPDTYNIYFADFYCIGTNFHYVILVITEYKSEADRFCNLHLPILNWSKNVFFRCDDFNDFEVTSKNLCIIEVMYTKNIYIWEALLEGANILDDTPLCRRGYNLRKNLNCRICNVRFKESRFDKKRNQPRRSSGRRRKVSVTSDIISNDMFISKSGIVTNIGNFPIRKNSIIVNSNEMNSRLSQLRYSFKIKRDLIPSHINQPSTNGSLRRGSLRFSQRSFANRKQNPEIRSSIRGVSPCKGVTVNQNMISRAQQGLCIIDDKNESEGDEKKEKIKKKSNPCNNCCTVQ